jgi:transcriptional regulator with XRE-family HTH domain
MKPHDLKAARLRKGWVQVQVAEYLGVTQAYVNMLENGRRRLTPALIRRVTALYGLSPETLPLSEEFVPARTDNQHLAESLAKLGYPGFAYMRPRVQQKNPAEVLLTALAQEKLEARVAEALPWIAMKYAHSGSKWLVGQGRKLNLQNRLGFVVSLALEVAERTADHDQGRMQSLRELRSVLDDSRLAREDAFFRPPKTDGERQWLAQNRSREAAHWNLLTDLRPEHLQYASCYPV